MASLRLLSLGFYSLFLVSMVSAAALVGDGVDNARCELVASGPFVRVGNPTNDSL